MRDLNGLPPGSTILWRNPEDRAYMRWGIVTLVLVTAGIAGASGYLVGAHARKRNPKRRRR